MDFATILFYAFSGILLFSAVQVITAKNPVHSALFLILGFFNAAGIWMLLQAEFLSIVLVLVYVGAVMILFLFVVMMIDVNMEKIREDFWGRLPLAAIVGVVIALEMSAVIMNGFPVTKVAAPSSQIGTTKALGKEIFTHYVFAFEVAAIILLLAIVAAVVLTLRRRKDSRYNDPSAAVKVKRNDRVRMVQMPAELDQPAIEKAVDSESTTRA